MTGTFDLADQGATIRVSLYPSYSPPIHLVIEGSTVTVTRMVKSGVLETSEPGNSAATVLRTAIGG